MSFPLFGKNKISHLSNLRTKFEWSRHLSKFQQAIVHYLITISAILKTFNLIIFDSSPTLKKKTYYLIIHYFVSSRFFLKVTKNNIFFTCYTPAEPGSFYIYLKTIFFYALLHIRTHKEPNARTDFSIHRLQRWEIVVEVSVHETFSIVPQTGQRHIRAMQPAMSSFYGLKQL